MIPDEAVEAAINAMETVTPPPGVDKSDWLKKHGRYALLAGAIAAAAPHLMAPIHAYLKEAVSMTTLDPDAIPDSYDQGFDDAIRGMADKIRSIMSGAEQ